jgi:hypothetical protein
LLPTAAFSLPGGGKVVAATGKMAAKTVAVVWGCFVVETEASLVLAAGKGMTKEKKASSSSHKAEPPPSMPAWPKRTWTGWCKRK